MLRNINNSFGSEMIPIRLIITISVITIISVFTVQGFNQYRLVRQEQMFTESLSIVQKNIEAMVRTGQPRDINDIHSSNGTKQVHQFLLPPIITNITFGYNPSISHQQQEFYQQNAITFFSQHSGQQILWCDEQYSFIKGVYNNTKKTWMPDDSHPMLHISGRGKVQLTFELITDGSSLFVLIYQQIE